MEWLLLPCKYIKRIFMPSDYGYLRLSAYSLSITLILIIIAVIYSFLYFFCRLNWFNVIIEFTSHYWLSSIIVIIFVVFTASILSTSKKIEKRLVLLGYKRRYHLVF